MTTLTDQLAADAPPVLERGSFQRDSASMTSDFKPRSDLVRVLQERGHIYQATDLEGLDRLALEGPISAYIGFDATASSLHVGSLVQIMTLRRLQQTGHRPIILMGGGTTKVGDPDRKSVV